MNSQVKKNQKFKTTSFAVFSFLFFACVIHAFYYYPQLPEVVASHFGAAGQPDAWAGKKVFITVYLISAGMNALIFGAIAFGLEKVPASKLNLPNKDYWLAEERREETYRFFFLSFMWFGSATFLLLLDIFHQAFMVHLGNAATLDHPLLSLGLYFGFAAAWCIVLFAKFFRKNTNA